MAVTLSRIAALLIALGYIVAAAVIERSFGPPLLAFLAVLMPVALIWFPEELGGSAFKRKKTIIGTYVEPNALRRPTRDSHPALVAAAGWFFLLVLPAIVYLLTRS